MQINGEYLTSAKKLFENRADAGAKLAALLSEYVNLPVVVLAIPNGGVPLAMQVAPSLKAQLDIIICRKLTLPMNPEGGLGALADDGTSILNEEVMKNDGISPAQIEHEIAQVKKSIRERRLLYRSQALPPRLNGQTAIIVDDGLASGITMSVAVKAVRHRQPRQVVVAVPLASATGFQRVSQLADKVICCAVAQLKQFFLADFYKTWRDVSDREVEHYLEQWRRRQAF
ncbi:MAG TPA: phosphoribosyltransferase family protein [Dehalococcoidales bacterium]|nr:phosphoribosyltransferase family protein [Dehalococcoidales bacterium]